MQQSNEHAPRISITNTVNSSVSASSNMSRKSFPEELINLFKQEGQYQKIMSMIEKESLHKFVDFDGTHLLHLAAKFNNHGIIIHVLRDLGCDVDIEDSSGTTPLITAIMYNNLNIGKMLFHQLINKLCREVPFTAVGRVKAHQSIATTLNSKLRDRSFTPEQIGEVFAKIGCDISAVINLNDPVITRAYLQHEGGLFNVDGLLDNVVPLLDMQCLEIMLHRLQKHNDRRLNDQMSEVFIYIMKRILDYQKTKSGRDTLKRIFSWEFFDESILKYLEKALKKSPRKNVKIFLTYGFHSAVKEKFGRDLLACLFGNRNPKVISLLKNEQIDVNGCGYYGNTPLHFAVEGALPQNIKFLLENGANPNALNNWHKSPVNLALHSCDEECLEALLIDSTDHRPTCEEINNYMLATFEEAEYDENDSDDDDDDFEDHNKIKFIISQLALYEAMGISIEKSIKVIYQYMNKPELKRFFKGCCQQLKCLKKNRLRGDREFTMFTILVEKPEKIAQYVSDADVQAIFMFVKDTRKTVYSFYRQRLKKHAKEIARINLCRRKANELICEWSGIPDSNHLVIHKINSYLSNRDLLHFQD